MEKLIELIEQWEDINQGLNDKELLSLSIKLRDLEDEVFQAMQNRIRDKRAATKYLELYRYYCEECGVSFKIDYEDGSVINFCPFCGTEEYGDKGHTDSIVFDGIFEYYAEELGKLEGQHFLALSILVKALEALKTEMEASNEFKEYVENMLIFNFDEYSIEEIIGVVYDHIYPQF